MGDIKIEEKTNETGGRLIISGCRFKIPHDFSSKNFTFGYLKDGWKFIKTDIQAIDELNFEPLVILTTNASNSGTYKCIYKYGNGTLADIGSKPVHVSFSGT